MAKDLSTEPAVHRSVVLGTAGHIDHGKTALIQALTGINTDRLPEEKSRGITIDLGFAAMDLIGQHRERFEVSFVDVPGHHGFIRNMLAGAGGVNAVMLVVAADEGVRAQTREHLQIIRLLGISHGVIAISKQDLVSSERLLQARQQITELVNDTFLADAAMIPVSARTGYGLDMLRQELVKVFSNLPLPEGGRIARLPVDRSFTVRGFGTVVTGTLQESSLHAGETLVLQPGSRQVRIRGLQVHGLARTEANAPNRVALNLSGVDVPEVNRGDVVTLSALQPSSILDVRLETLPDQQQVRHRQRVKFYAFAAEANATALSYGSDRGRFFRLKLDRPQILLPGDRFVLRLPSPTGTLGGGVVLDAHPLSRLRKALVAEWLSKLEMAGPPDQLVLRVERDDLTGCTLARLVTQTGWTAGKVQEMLEPLLTAGTLIQHPGTRTYITARAFAEAQQRLHQELVEREREGFTRAELQSRVPFDDWILDRALTVLMAEGQVSVRDNHYIRAGEENAAGQDEADHHLQTLEVLYKNAGLAPPLVSAVAEQVRMNAADLRTLLTALLRSGRLVRLGSDALLIHKDPLDRLVQLLKQRRGQNLDISSFKQMTGLTRKHAIPLLEFLDGRRITRTIGNTRIIN